MITADEALSREVERGMTRQDLLKRAGALGIVVTGGSFGPLTEAAFASTQIRRGGTFRQATSGGSTDFIDGQHIVAKSDIARLVAGFEGLARFDEKGKIVNHLAEELKAEKANQYLIRIRPGIEFHNGKTMTIDDVIYSIQRTKNPKLKLFGNAAFGAIDLKRIKKLDKRTCRLVLSRADVTLMEAFAQYFQGIVPKGYQPSAVGQGSAAVRRDRPVQGQELHPGPRERARQERELLAIGRAVLRPGSDHQLPVRRGQGQCAPLRADRGHGGRAVRPGARGQASQQPPHLHGPDRRVDAAVHESRRRHRSTTYASGGRSACSSTGPRSCSRASPGSGESATTSTRRSTRRTRATSSRSAGTTPSRRGRCSGRRVRRT